jgi:hypothetical protein
MVQVKGGGAFCLGLFLYYMNKLMDNLNKKNTEKIDITQTIESNGATNQSIP